MEIYRTQNLHSLIRQTRLAVADRFAEELNLATGCQALDVGCGAGMMTVSLARRGAIVHAMDRVPAMLEAARKLADRERLSHRVTLSLGDAKHLPFRSESVDLVVALGLIGWIPSPKAALSEMTRVLKPGAWMIASTGNARRMSFLFDPLENPFLAPLRKKLKMWFSGAAGDRVRREHLSFTLSRRLVVMHQYGDSESRRLMELHGLRRIRSSTCGFGPFTFLRTPLVPQGWDVRSHLRLQRMADLGVPGLRSGGSERVTLLQSQ